MTPTKQTEKILGQLAYTGYLMGRICAVVPIDSPLRTTLATRYAAPSRQPVEAFGFLVGLRDSDSTITSASALLTVAHMALGMDKAPKPARRRPRPDDRWGARS